MEIMRNPDGGPVIGHEASLQDQWLEMGNAHQSGPINKTRAYKPWLIGKP